MNKFLRGVNKNSSTILTVMAIAGLGTTVYLAVKATPRALAAVEDGVWEKKNMEAPEAGWHEYLVGEPNELQITRELRTLGPKGVFLATWQHYLPAAIMGGVTIACIIGIDRVNSKKIAALAGAYAISETALREYQDKVVEQLGEAKHQQIRDAVANDHLVSDPPSTREVIIIGEGDVLCRDEWSKRYFMSSPERIKQCMNELNEQLLHGEFISLNDLYFAWGLETNDMGESMGWFPSPEFGMINLEFTSGLTEGGRPCLVISHRNSPAFLN